MILADRGDQQEHDSRPEYRPSDTGKAPADSGEEDRQDGQDQQGFEQHGAESCIRDAVAARPLSYEALKLSDGSLCGVAAGPATMGE